MDYKTKHPETLSIIFQFSMIFMSYYEEPPTNRNTIDRTIEDFLIKLNKAIDKDG